MAARRLQDFRLRHPCRPGCAHARQLSQRGRKGRGCVAGSSTSRANAPADDLHQGSAPLSPPPRRRPNPMRAPSGYMAGFTGVKRTREPSPLVDADPGERIKDMDLRGRRRKPDAAVGLVRHLDRRRRRRPRNGDVPRLSPLDGGLLRRLSEPARRRDSRRRPRHRRRPRRDPTLGPSELGLGDDGLRAGRHAARPSRTWSRSTPRPPSSTSPSCCIRLP